MSRLINKRAKRAARRGDPHALAEVTRITRTSFNKWAADVTYLYGRTTWSESVSFIRTPRTRKNDIIVIIDTDYPTDRAHRIVIDKGADMVSTINNYIIAGRW